jgi:hypothetical protein
MMLSTAWRASTARADVQFHGRRYAGDLDGVAWLLGGAGVPDRAAGLIDELADEERHQHTDRPEERPERAVARRSRHHRWGVLGQVRRRLTALLTGFHGAPPRRAVLSTTSATAEASPISADEDAA